MSEYTLWCLIEQDVTPFSVDIMPTLSIDKLKDEIKRETSPFLEKFAAKDLILWKLDVDLNDPAKKKIIGEGQFRHSPNDNPLDGFETISDVWSGQPHAKHVSVFVKLPDVISPKLLQMSPDTNMDTRRECIIKIRSCDLWKQHLCDDDLRLSNIRLAGSSQNSQEQSVHEFQENLSRKRFVDDAIRNVYASFLDTVQACSTISQVSLTSYFESLVQAGTDVQELDRVTIQEFIHYTSVYCGQGLRSKEDYEQDKEAQVRALLLQFAVALRSRRSFKSGFDLSLPFPFIIETNDSDQKYTYRPRPDFHVCINDFPYIILEVTSYPNEADEFRMLLQAASISRIGHKLRSSEHVDKPIFNMAIFIDGQFRARQHILCQPHDFSPVVEYVTKDFDLTNPQSAFEFIFQMYNFLSDAEAENKRLDRPKLELARVKESVMRKNLPSLSSAKRGSEESQDKRKSPKKSSKRNPGTSASGGAKDSFDSPTVLREVAKAGYTPTQPVSDEEEITLLTPLKSTMRQATSRSGLLVVLKTVDANECQLLQYLNAIRAPSNHTIPLLDVIDFNIKKSIIVLPWKAPLDEVLRFGDRPDDVVSLCLQFIEGVAFLHQHNVAHCDLKPENVVVDTKSESAVSPRVFIIDYDLALSVGSEETMTEGWCGTPPWIAPELGSRNGPIRQYSPILADRWSCGRMIEYFAKYFPTYEGARKTWLLAFARQLLDANPRARPELNQLQDIHGPRKRKAASQQVPIPKRHAAPTLLLDTIRV